MMDKKISHQGSGGALKKFTKSNHSVMNVTLKRLNNTANHESSCNTITVNETTSRIGGPSAWQHIPKHQHFHKTLSTFGSVNTTKSIYSSRFLKNAWPELQHRSLNNQEKKVKSIDASKCLTFANMVKDGDFKIEPCRWDPGINSSWSDLIPNTKNCMGNGDKEQNSYYKHAISNSPNLSNVSHPINAGNIRTEGKSIVVDAPLIVGNPTDSDRKVLDRRIRRNMKKIMLKEEKRRVKEEEVRRKMVAPKDQRVRLVDHSLLEKIVSNNSVTKVNMCNVLPINNENFPVLGDIKRPIREVTVKCTDAAEPKSVNQDQNIQKTVETDVNIQLNSINNIDSVSPKKSANLQEKQSKVEEKVMFSVSDTINEENNKNEMHKLTIKPILFKKKPKRKDPIKIDILQAIKNLEMKHHKETASSIGRLNRKVNRIETLPHDYGNQLDSSNPERSRGKMREIPKRKRLSKLKIIILAERFRHQRSSDTELINSLKGLCMNSHSLSNLDETINNTLNPSQNPSKSDVIIFKEEKSRIFSHCFETEKDNDVSKGSNYVDLVSKGKDPEQTNPYLSELNVSLINTEQKYGNIKTVSGTSSCLCKDIKGDISQCVREKCHVTKEFANFSLNNDKAVASTSNLNMIKLKSDKSSVIKETSELLVKSSIHSRKFRDYCDHSLTPELNDAVKALVRDVVKFHDRQYQRDPLKANAKRRHVVGLKEVKKFLSLKRLKFIVIAPDLEIVQAQGGLDEMVSYLKELATAQQVPYVFALGRRELGRLTLKKVPISCLGIINYEGTENNFEIMLTSLAAARIHYQAQMKALMHGYDNDVAISKFNQDVPSSKEEEESDDVNKQVIASLLAKLTEKEPSSPETPFFRALSNQSFQENEGSDTETD